MLQVSGCMIAHVCEVQRKVTKKIHTITSAERVQIEFKFSLQLRDYFTLGQRLFCSRDSPYCCCAWRKDKQRIFFTEKQEQKSTENLFYIFMKHYSPSALQVTKIDFIPLTHFCIILTQYIHQLEYIIRKGVFYDIFDILVITFGKNFFTIIYYYLITNRCFFYTFCVYIVKFFSLVHDKQRRLLNTDIFNGWHPKTPFLMAHSIYKGFFYRNL